MSFDFDYKHATRDEIILHAQCMEAEVERARRARDRAIECIDRYKADTQMYKEQYQLMKEQRSLAERKAAKNSYEAQYNEEVIATLRHYIRTERDNYNGVKSWQFPKDSEGEFVQALYTELFHWIDRCVNEEV